MTPFITFRELRLAKGMDSGNVAEYLGVAHEVFIKYENRVDLMPWSIAKKLCALYEVPSIDCIMVG